MEQESFKLIAENIQISSSSNCTILYSRSKRNIEENKNNRGSIFVGKYSFFFPPMHIALFFRIAKFGWLVFPPYIDITLQIFIGPRIMQQRLTISSKVWIQLLQMCRHQINNCEMYLLIGFMVFVCLFGRIQQSAIDCHLSWPRPWLG